MPPNLRLRLQVRPTESKRPRSRRLPAEPARGLSLARCVALAAIFLDSTCWSALATAAGAEPAAAATATADALQNAAPEEVEREAEQASTRELGYTFTSDDARHALHVWLRGQLRLSDPFDDDPLRAAQFESRPGSDVDIRRARLNAAGHLFDPSVQYFYVHELTDNTPLLDLGVDFVLDSTLWLRVGQYKAFYNRERVDSSGDQQFVERSIATYAFTLDRQRGVTVSKTWATGTRAQNQLLTGLFEGTGRAASQGADEPTVIVRWEWDFLGETLPYSQSDIRMRSTPAASLAFASARIEGPYTRFSSAGGGQLDGFEPGDSSRYSIEQWLEELAWHYRGYSLQQEYHVKTILDRDTTRESELSGGYVQLGKVWPVPRSTRTLPVELAFRYAKVAWDGTPLDRDQRELTAVLNVFFDGHANKLSFEVSRLELDETSNVTADDTRLRAQWEVSF